MRQQATSVAPPRAVSGRSTALRVKIARAVAPWDAFPHRYEGPPTPQRRILCLRRSLLTEFQKEGDATVRHRALQGLSAGIIKAVEGQDILDPLTVSASEVHRLAWFKSGDAERYLGMAG